MEPRPTWRRVWIAAATLTAGALLLSACAGSASAPGTSAESSGDPVFGGNITVQIPQDPGSLDSVASGNVSTGVIGRHMFESLFEPNAANEPTPVLATGYERSDDGLTWTIGLRDGLKFSDGTPVVAEDAAASLNYWIKNSSFADSLGKLLVRLEATDDHTVVIETSSPFPVLNLISSSEGSRVVKADTANNADATGFSKEETIGTGPYKLKSWNTEEIVLERNDEYQAPEGETDGYAGKQNAYLDTITFKVVADADAVVNGLQSGLWDIAQPTGDNYALLKDDPSLKVAILSGGDINGFYQNFNPESVMSDSRARDALNLLLDKDAIRETTGGDPDLATASGGFAMEGSALYSAAGEDVYKAHDVEKAKELFAQAGVKEGDTLKFVTTGEFPQFKEWAVMAQDQLKQIGIESTIETYDFGTMLDKLDDPSAWDVCPLFDVALPPVPQFSDAVKGLSKGKYHSDEMDQLVLDYNKAEGDAVQPALDAIQALAWKDKAAIVLYQSKSYVAHSPKLQGYDGWKLWFANTWVEES